MTKYNEFLIDGNELGECFVATITNNGVYLDHNWMDGELFIKHDDFSELNEYRKEFLEEIE